VIPGRDEAYAVWEAILRRLEVDLGRSEHALSGTPHDDVEPWTAPCDAPPLPEDLLPRARDLLARQERLKSLLSGALVETLERRRAATPRHAHATHAPRRPAYLDVHA
jgi:hypothetical protein